MSLAQINSELATLFDKRVNLNANEQKVLRELAESYDPYEGFHFIGFKSLMRRTRLPRAKVRVACRSLARKGLAEFCRPLWNDDGQPAGAGYGCTKKGKEYADKLPPRRRRRAA